MATSIPKRYLIACLAFLGYMIIAVLQEAQDIVFVDMRAKKLPNGTYDYGDNDADYQVTQLQEANTLGFLITFLGGAFATTFGGAITFGSGIGLSGCIAILTPALIRVPIQWAIRLKYLDGLLQGLAYCGVADLWARWSLLEERARVVAFAMTGAHIGSLAEHLVPQLGRNDVLSYGTIFTIIGAFSGIWAIVWLLYVRSDPSKDESISECERARLAYRIKYVGNHRIFPEDYPWMEILTSKPVWAIFVASFLNSCGFAICYFHIPYDMIESGLIKEETEERIRFIVEAFTAAYWFPAGYICDWARTKYNPTLVHKCFVCSGLLIAAALLIIYVIVGNKSLVVLIVIYGIFPLGMVMCDLAFMVNVIDLSPKYASLISGFEITFFTAGSLFSEYLLLHWYTSAGYSILQYVFVAFSMLFCCGAAVYYFWADTKLQNWNQLPRSKSGKSNKRASALTALTVE